MFKLSDSNQKAIGQLLTPSWLSGLIAVAAGLVVSVGVIVAFQFNTSGLQQQLIAWQENQPSPALTTPGENLPENDHPTLQGSWPLLLFWSLIGLGVYAISLAIIHNLSRAEELRESLGYVNARPQAAIATTAEHIVLRLIATIVLVVLAGVFVRQILPYSITAAHASAFNVLSVDGGLYALLSFMLVSISLHVDAILLRLALGRVRIFSAS